MARIALPHFSHLPSPIRPSMAAKKKSDGKALPGDAALRKEMLHSMLLQRRFEEKVGEAYALGKIGGFCHLYIGQEAVSTGIISMLRPDDYVITTYRDHGQAGEGERFLAWSFDVHWGQHLRDLQLFLHAVTRDLAG